MSAVPVARTEAEVAPLRLEELVSRAHSWADPEKSPDAEEILGWTADHFGERVAVVTSFQAEGMVVIDQLHRLGLPMRVLTIDTGRLPDETYRQIERTRSRYDLEVEVVHAHSDELAETTTEHGPDFFRRSPEMRMRCCYLRKVLPFRRAARGLDCWISGVRRGQGGDRQGAVPVALDLTNRPAGGLVKVSPLVHWSEERVWDYLRQHGVPYHPLYDEGYRSIGCAPCTRPSRPGEGPREARWWWEGGAAECGLHSVSGSTPMSSRPVPLGGLEGQS